MRTCVQESASLLHLRSQLMKKNAVREHLKEAFSALEGWLYEGCLGQFAEIYDGECPTISRGCFAQAWSVGEILRAVSEYEKEEQNAGN